MSVFARSTAILAIAGMLAGPSGLAPLQAQEGSRTALPVAAAPPLPEGCELPIARENRGELRVHSRQASAQGTPAI